MAFRYFSGPLLPDFTSRQDLALPNRLLQARYNALRSPKNGNTDLKGVEVIFQSKLAEAPSNTGFQINPNSGVLEVIQAEGPTAIMNLSNEQEFARYTWEINRGKPFVYTEIIRRDDSDGEVTRILESAKGEGALEEELRYALFEGIQDPLIQDIGVNVRPLMRKISYKS
ncbi:MAG: hypothetical protein KTR14_00875 [Vampirovibrio sp.]|nr:hypothetical protein [Vampirovibrio sp.]